jgi:alpha-2-macroglobulin
MKLKYLNHPGIITCIGLIALTVIAHFYNIGSGKTQPYSAYSQYITAFTSGEISKASPIMVRFVDEMVRPAEVNRETRENPFEFNPYMSGTCKWIDTRTIQFTPTWPLESNTLYKATLTLTDILPGMPDSLELFPFHFRTRNQSFKVAISNAAPMNNESPQWQKIQGTLVASDMEREDKIKSMFTAFHESKELQLKWTHDRENHHFTIDSILRTNETSEVIIKWSDDNKDRKVIAIPALGTFSHINTTKENYPAQCITLEFSDPIKKDQLLDGLIRIADIDSKFSIENNRIYVYPKKRLLGNQTVVVEKAIQNIKGLQLQNRSSVIINFEEDYPELRALGKGTIIPPSASVPFAFEAVNLSAVDVRIIKITEKNIPQFLQINKLDGSAELQRVGIILMNKKISLGKNKNTDLKNWNRHLLDLSKLIQTEPGAIYEVAIGFRKSYSLYNCQDTSAGESADMLSMSSRWDEPSNYDDYYYDNDDYEFDYYGNNEHYDNRDNPCKKSYYRPQKAIVRNVLASNLGLIAKRGSEGTMFVTVTDLLSTTPLSEATIEIFDYQQQLVAKGKTEANGTANIKVNKKPFLLVASLGRQRGYLRIDEGSSLSLSRFDIGGNEYHKGMKGFIYGERDVWRPGDSIYLNFMLEDKLNALPLNHPVVLELYSPKETLVKRVVKTSSLDHLYTFHTNTESDAPTGNYMVKVRAGGALFEKTIKVETIIPNRLKIQLDWTKKDSIEKNKKIEGILSARWLHGASAQNLNADVSVTLRSSPTAFKKYPAYTFDDPSKKFQSETKSVYKGKLNEKGISTISTEINLEASAPGILKAIFKARVFEPGGNFSTDYFSIPFYPYDVYTGIKVPEGASGGMLVTDKDHAVKIVTVDINGDPVSGKKLVVQLYKISWKWWWDSSDEEEFSYNGKMYSQPFKTDSLITRKGQAVWNLKVKAPDWGRYLIRVTEEGGHSTGKIVYIDWPGWRGRGEEDNPEGAKMLVFSSEKEVYAVGENITLNIPTGFAGRALLSLESGTKVIGSYWIAAQKGTTQFKFPATKNMAPNVYAHITLLQPHAQTSNDLPMRMYGIIPIKVEDPATHLRPVITMPDQLRPEQMARISISEQEGKPMTYTIAVVDEGLLDLTRYHTPDVWTNFNERQTLDVKTWDLFDDVAGADATKIKNLLSIGGDGNRGPLEGAKANRFKPVVIFMGPFHINGGEKRTHLLKIPNYVGSVRAMVIAGYKGSYGNSEKSVQVKKPIMVLGTLPRVLSPNENFKFPVTLFAMDKNIKNVSVDLEINGLIISEGNKLQQANFSEPGEKLISFPLKVSAGIGLAKIKVTAKCGKEVAVYATEVEVRNPNPEIKNIYGGVLEGGQSRKDAFDPAGMKGTNNTTIEVSSIPPINLGTRLNYLIRYPYGCVEQTTSSVFPQLYLSKLLNLSKERKNEIDENIRSGISRLKNFQIVSGGLSYWPGGYEANEWGTCYAGHFMLEAELAGYILPFGFKEKWILYQKNLAREGGEGDELTQAYRLYLLALAKAAELGAMNRMRMEKIESVPAAWYLAAAYHLAGQPEIAKKISENIPLTVAKYKELSNTFGSNERDKAIILQSLSIIGEKAKAAPLMKDLSNILNSDQYMNTQATSYALVSIAKYIGKQEPSARMHFSYRLKDGKWKEVTSASPIWQHTFVNNEKETVEIKNLTIGILFTKIIARGIPEAGDQTDARHDLGMEVVYRSMDGKKMDPSMIMQGTDFMAEVTLTNPGSRGLYKQMSLSQIFPSGWEIHNSRMDVTGQIPSGNIPNYQDIRDDRVNIFYDLKAGEQKKFIILLNASYEGRFYLPTVYAEAMYDNTINGRKHGQWVEVKSNKNLIP